MSLAIIPDRRNEPRAALDMTERMSSGNAEADYILLQNTERVYLTDEMLESGEFVKVISAPRAEKCRWQSVIQVYQRGCLLL